MIIEQCRWSAPNGWLFGSPGQGKADLVLAFGSGASLEEGYAELRAAYPGACIMGCSTAGEIFGSKVLDATLVSTAISFGSTQVRSARSRVLGREGSRAAGAALARDLTRPDLVHVLAVSDGLSVNGSELALGLAEGLPEGVRVTGGLAADGSRFERTLAFLDAPPEPDLVAAVGFYGRALRVGCGSYGGWDPFGVELEITRSSGSVLYELDGRPALELYEAFLGDHAAGLPAAGLLFPLSIRDTGGRESIVRTLSAVDRAEGSLTFAGDVPQGRYARFMKANFDRLIEGAGKAAESCAAASGQGTLAVLISCVGRRLVLRQRVEEEVEAVRDVLGAGTVLSGFYSYGELSPSASACELHNQTMTITTFAED